MIFILIQHFIEGFDGIGDMVLNFIVFFVVFGVLQMLFGGIFYKNKT
ncbi:MAG: hypothetical protein ACOCU1_01955 [Bacillota bacterium]